MAALMAALMAAQVTKIVSFKNTKPTIRTKAKSTRF